MFAILLRAISFFTLIMIGSALKKTSLFGPNAHRTVSNVVMYLTLPCAIVTGFRGKQPDHSLFIMILLGFLASSLMVAYGYLLARNRSNEEKVFNIANYSGFSIGSFTLPFVQSFMGQTSIIATCFFDAGNALICTGGSYAIACTIQKDTQRMTLREFVKKLATSPAILTYVSMSVLLFFGITLPDWFFDFISPAANANAFTSMLMLGLSMKITFPLPHGRRILKYMMTRYAFCTVLALLVYHLAPFDLELRQTVVLLLFSPLAAMAPHFTDRLGSDYEFSALLASLTILISLPVMTAITLLIHG